MPTHSNDFTCLNHIATILVDAGKLYSRAARIADDPTVVDRIERTMAERDVMLREVRALASRVRGDRREHGSMLGVAHKAFLDVRSLFDRDTRAALSEVDRGEKYLCDEIRKAIRNQGLSSETRAFLGLMLDRVTNGEMQVQGKLDEIERTPHAGETIHPLPPHH